MTRKDRILFILLITFLTLWMVGIAYIEMQSGYCSYNDVLQGCE